MVNSWENDREIGATSTASDDSSIAQKPPPSLRASRAVITMQPTSASIGMSRIA